MPVQARFKKVVMLVTGWGFIVVGIAGLFLPVLQGVLFLVIGLFILSSEYVWAHRLLQKLRDRFPRLDSRWDAVTAVAHRWTGKVLHRT